MVESELRFAGYAAVFGHPDRGGDVVRRGAFARSLGRGAPIPLLWQHRPGRAIGQIEYLREDKRGLRVIARLSDARATEALRAGRAMGLSFGYRVRAARDGPLRELVELDLVEVSLVSDPMQPQARVHATTG